MSSTTACDKSAKGVTQNQTASEQDTCVLCQQKVGTGGSGWGHPQVDMDMVAARLGFERAMAMTGWATSHPDCMGRLRKHYSYLVGVDFWQGMLLALRTGV